jgi:hypothetical protein
MSILLQEQILTKASQILRIHGKQFKQIKGSYTDNANGRCAMGVIADYLGWKDQKRHKLGNNTVVMFDDNIVEKMTKLYDTTKLDEPLPLSIVKMNDFRNKTFDEIADWLEERGL